ncbi:hypothetical protein AB5J72_28840 [Streptomyces sp. CG1]|uniref:hypothetical protein n=1 Tax=Streptomyces sp. CG1 TaxID=1287523 RepID=UPI0034E1E6D3
MVTGQTRRTLTPLIRVYAYTFIAAIGIGFWVWNGLMALIVWLSHSKAVAGATLAGWEIIFMLPLPATLMWHAPELLKREFGPWPERVRGFPRYLLRNAHKGVEGGSLPLNLEGPEPPMQFWLVAWMFTIFNGFMWTTDLPDTVAWATLHVLSCAASLAALAVLFHGSVTRRRAARTASGKKVQAADGHR